MATVDSEALESFPEATCAGGSRPHADPEVGLADSTAVILSNIAMEEYRRVAFKEIETMRFPRRCCASTQPARRIHNNSNSVGTIANHPFNEPQRSPPKEGRRLARRSPTRSTPQR